jgi:peptidoglycan LD-endopeptidase CwlK
MTFKLGKASEDNLLGVRPDLIAVVRNAIARSSQDFSVFEGVRSLERQKTLFAAGASRTLDSYHLTGEAVDLVPYVGGRVQWQMPLCLQVARAMGEASRHLRVPVIWGGVWDRELASLELLDLDEEVAEYVTRFRASNGRPPLVDGPHFQRVRVK